MNLDFLFLYIYMSGWRDGLKHAEERLEAWNGSPPSPPPPAPHNKNAIHHHHHLVIKAQ